MSNFFNAIGVADMERVHSAMIAWILDDENDSSLKNGTKQTNSKFTTFPQNDRSLLICKLFNVTPYRFFSSIKTHVEWNDIDIMIETKDQNGCDEIWVIENKLKSQEHKSKVNTTQQQNWNIKANQIWQTQKYEYVINDYFSSINIANKHFLLLSLGGDEAKSPSKLWQTIKYADLYNILSGVNLTNLPSYSIICEYINSIGEINSELQKFLSANDLNKYSNVFKKLNKANKIKYLKQGGISIKERFIVENGLETIFQKQFLIELVKKAINSGLQINLNNLEIDDDNGIAEFNYTCYTYKVSNKEMYLQVQFQGGTFKAVLIHENYRYNKSADFIEIYGAKQGQSWNGCWYQRFIKEFGKLSKYKTRWTLEPAKKLDSTNPKPRIALDTQMPTKQWYNYNDPKVVKMFVTLFNETEKVVDDIHNLP